MYNAYATIFKYMKNAGLWSGEWLQAFIGTLNEDKRGGKK